MSRILRRATTVATAATLLASSLAAVALSPVHANPAGTALVISEAYGGGGNTGSTYTHDFIELYNPTDAAISVDGMSVQWRSAGGPAAATGVTELSGSVVAGGHYLVQQAQGSGGTTPLPTPDATGTIAMGGRSGTAMLVVGTTAVDPGTGAFAGDPAVIDLVGIDSNVYETAAAPGMSNSTSSQRADGDVDTDDNSADFLTSEPTPAAAYEPPPPPQELDLTIEQIQGEGMTSPYVEPETMATTSGVVTAAYPSGGFFGFYIQMPGTGAADLDLATHDASPAIFVYQPFGTGDVTVQPGDHVQVRGLVTEHAGATQLTIESADDIVVLDDVVAAVTTTTSAWPATDEEKETLEGMLYRPTGDFTITETYFTNRFGEVGLARGKEPLLQPTEVARPGTPEAEAVQADNQKRRIVLDDASSTSFLSKGDLTPPYISNDEPIRVGAPADFTGDVIFTQGGSPSSPTYRFQPLTQVVGPDNTASPAEFQNTRTAAPDEELVNETGTADLKVASFNVLNYFTTLGDPDDDNTGDGGCLPYTDRDGDGATVRTGCPLRGAWDPEDFERQQEKIVSAINALDAHVVGLMEIENSAKLGEDADEATESLVAALNADAGADVWAANPSSADLPSTDDQDVITNAIIYKPAAVERHGDARALGHLSGDMQPFVNAREPIAQAFAPVEGDDPFLVVVNHFKSKGSAGPFPGDQDTGDGQARSNGSRVLQATALRDWVPGVQEDLDVDDVLLIGDFNSYSMEDPLQVLYDADYTNVEQHYDNEEYSYSFSSLSGSLDHVLANESALARSTGTDIWNINSGEALALEYSRWNYNATDFHEPGPYRSSDHDPVVLGLVANDEEPEKAAPTIEVVRQAPPMARARKTSLNLWVEVSANGFSTVSGTVRVLQDGTELASGTLHRGSVRLTLPPFSRVGEHRLQIVFDETDDVEEGSVEHVVDVIR